MRIVAVTGTGTGVGKTISSAAIAATALRNGERVAVVKPVQTGVLACEPGDLAVVHELTGLADLHEFDRYPEPLAPATAARRMGRPGLEIGTIADRIRRLSDRDLVIVEGAGGALVRFNTDGQTFLDLVVELASELRLKVVLVATAGLGVLNAAALTAAAFAQRAAPVDSVLIGDWPTSTEPDEVELAARCNLTDLADYAAANLCGVIPHGVGSLSQPEFTDRAPDWLAPELGGRFDVAKFVAQHAAPFPAQKGLS